jgi:hypothetical protein
MQRSGQYHAIFGLATRAALPFFLAFTSSEIVGNHPEPFGTASRLQSIFRSNEAVRIVSPLPQAARDSRHGQCPEGIDLRDGGARMKAAPSLLHEEPKSRLHSAALRNAL